MKIHFSDVYSMIPKQLLRKAGYHEFVDPRTRKVSYARQLRPGVLYPRFHIYVDQAEQGFVLNLHLDQKKPSYKGTSAHAGEYNGEVVEQEAARIQAVLQSYKMNI